MGARSELKAAVFARLRDELAARRFEERRGGGIFTRMLGDDVHGWIGLNTASRARDALEINVVVGVRHDGIERRLAELTGGKPHAFVPPTICRHLGYETPASTYTPLHFEPAVDPAPEIARAMAELEQHGLPFMTRHADLDALCRALVDGRIGIPGQNEERAIVALALREKRAECETFIAAQLARCGARTDAAAQRMRELCAGVRAQWIS